MVRLRPPWRVSRKAAVYTLVHLVIATTMAPLSSTETAADGSRTAGSRASEAGARFEPAPVVAYSAPPAPLALSWDGEWQRIVTSPVPTARWWHSSVYVPSSRRMVIFGGATGIGTPMSLDDTWAYDLDQSDWIAIVPGGPSPSPRFGHSAIYDAANERMIVWGGSSSIGFLWQLSLSGTPTWSTVPHGGSKPSARSHHSAIYDPVREQMIVYGPSGDPNVYLLPLQGPAIWTKVAPSGGPGSAVSAIYDPVGDRMIVLTADEVWELTLAGPMVWNQLTTAGSQPPDEAFRFPCPVYDSFHDRIVMFNGGDIHSWGDKTYALSLAGPPTWSLLQPSGSSPPVRNASACIYDPVTDRLVLHGGVYVSGTGSVSQYGDVHHLTFGDVVTATEPVSVGGANRILAVRPNPGNSSHAFAVELSASGAGGRIEVFAVTGQRVWSQSIGHLPAGPNRIEWDGRRSSGRFGDPGVYLVRLTRSGSVSTRRFVRVR